MEALIIILMVLLMASIAYNYNNKIVYGPRYGLQTRSRSPFGRMQFDRATFRTTQFRRPPFRSRFHPRLYSEKYLRERSANPSLSPWVRKNNPEIITEIPKNPNDSASIFGKLVTKQVNAVLVTDKTRYPWIARVVATPDDTAPVICTAACIEERIFVTAAICILNAKVYYTRVYYQDQALQPLTFVLPSKRTKAMFHDVGLIVVRHRNLTKPWNTTYPFFTDPKYSHLFPNNDKSYQWMTTLYGGWYNTWVIGYVGEPSEQEYLPNKPNNIVYSLYELNIKTSPFLCNHVYNQHLPSAQFYVPCYSVCNLKEYSQNMSKCYAYLAGEGHIIIGYYYKRSSILGAATWGGHYKTGLNKPPLPVGFAAVFSAAFDEDFECARNITKAPETSERFDTFCK